MEIRYERQDVERSLLRRLLELCGLYTMIQHVLGVPFGTEILGKPVTVEPGSGCPSSISPQLSRGSEWIEAYRHWVRGRQVHRPGYRPYGKATPPGAGYRIIPGAGVEAKCHTEPRSDCWR